MLSKKGLVALKPIVCFGLLEVRLRVKVCREQASKIAQPLMLDKVTRSTEHFAILWYPLVPSICACFCDIPDARSERIQMTDADRMSQRKKPRPGPEGETLCI